VNPSPLEKTAAPANRRRLTALVAAGTKLDAASRTSAGNRPEDAMSTVASFARREDVHKIAAKIDAFIKR